jgi:hypothetical protein
MLLQATFENADIYLADNLRRRLFGSRPVPRRRVEYRWNGVEFGYIGGVVGNCDHRNSPLWKASPMAASRSASDLAPFLWRFLR